VLQLGESKNMFKEYCELCKSFCKDAEKYYCGSCTIKTLKLGEEADKKK
jgi:hypothetical protein